MTVFQKVPGIDYKPDEIWVNPSPQGLWSRVAVVSMWTPLSRTRKAWGDKPAVIGMLRTIPGIDLLVRGLLANPQIRVVMIDGVDASADKATSKALAEVWGSVLAWPRVLPMLDTTSEALISLFRDVRLLNSIPRIPFDESEHRMSGPPDPYEGVLNAITPTDRPSGALVLPPPPPKANAPAPHGDPGERVVGDTLADVWPVILHRIMAFGRPVPTQYGETRELLNLVSVIRKPADAVGEQVSVECSNCGGRGSYASDDGLDTDNTCGSCNGDGLVLTPHPVLGLTYAQVADYARQFLDRVPPGGDGTAYAYGARLRASPVFGSVEGLWHSDQIAAIHSLLVVQPNTRAAFLTPWRPETDSGVESGRPCLVGVTFRAAPTGDWSCGDMHAGHVFPGRDRDGYCPTCGPGKIPQHPVVQLHMTVTFRSHDMHGAYALNLAALCLWLCEEAKALGMAVGTLTCVSQSAHVYERDYNAANAKIEAHKWPAIEWDQRSTWRVEVYETEEINTRAGPCEEIEELQRCGEPAMWVDDDRHYFCTEHKPQAVTALPKVKAIRAMCFTPDGNKTTRVFEGKTASGLLQEIERSGLITSIGNAMWLGGELVKAEGKL